LSLNDEEVDELVDISNHGVEGLFRDSVVLAGADLASQAIVQKCLSGNLSRDSNTENHPSQLEGPPENIQIPNREDE
jgi:hypothetical protein